MKKFISFFLAAGAFLLTPQVAFAHCPLCVAGAGAGLTLSRLVGIDDSITGLWLAAFLGAVSFLTYNRLSGKFKIKAFFLAKPALYVAIFAATIWSFYKFNLVVRMGTIYGIDKLTFGMVVGGVVFYLIDVVNDTIYKVAGRSLFPYQRMVLSLGSILVLSVIDYFLISYYI
ncbi:MAG TPA: hypothetical protein VJ227_01340 [Patescibacteria group bacterium]|nr:hypothetical protein [Patescibacteria group bacterium]